MDSPVLLGIFRRLFSHEVCSNHQYQSLAAPSLRSQQVRNFATKAPARGVVWQKRADLFSNDKSEELKRYPMVTADALRGRKERPRRVKMLTRDFIEGLQHKLVWEAYRS